MSFGVVGGGTGTAAAAGEGFVGLASRGWAGAGRRMQRIGRKHKSKGINFGENKEDEKDWAETNKTRKCFFLCSTAALTQDILSGLQNDMGSLEGRPQDFFRSFNALRRLFDLETRPWRGSQEQHAACACHITFFTPPLITSQTAQSGLPNDKAGFEKCGGALPDASML